MKHYELTLLIRPELSDDELNSLGEKLTNLLQEADGILVEKTRPIRRQLPLPIQKSAQAFLLSINFQLDPQATENLKNKLDQESQLLRYTLLAKEPTSVKKRISREEAFLLGRKEASKKVEIGQIEKKLEEILGE